MPTKIAAGEGIPSAFYRNAIDLNRFSNTTSKKLINSYNSVILKAVEQLKKIEKQPKNKQPAYKAARLRALVKQTKKSLDSWANLSVDELIADLEGVAKVQTGFIADQMKKALPSGMEQKIVNQLGYSVKSVAVSPSFAKAVVNTDPTALNISVLSDDLAGIVKPKGTFRLTAKQGQTITLPNGETVKKSFRGLAQSQAKRFNQVIRTGLLSGETTDQITRELVGTLDFGDHIKSLKQLQLAGGQVTKMANGQISTIVRTSINQVSNAASQSVYKANPDITEEYRYVATLDSRTSPICRDLDGSVFKYNQGPEPPQHFGCRSTTVAVINYKKWGFDPPPVGKRASADGPVPANTTYGKWLYEQKKPKTKFEPGREQIAALGATKAKYFNRLSNKYGPDQALKKLVRDDNTEVSLVQLQKRYGKPEDIKPKPKIDWDAVSKSPKTKASLAASKKLSEKISKMKPPSKALIAKEGKYMTPAEKVGKVKYKPLTAEQKKIVDQSVKETTFKKFTPEVATVSKLDQWSQDHLKEYDKVDLTKAKHKKWFENQKGLFAHLVPKGKYDTISPKQLKGLVQESELAQLQKKFDKAAKKAEKLALEGPKPKVKRAPLKKWDDKSFIPRDIANDSDRTPPPPRTRAKNGKKTTKDLFYDPDRKNAMQDYGLSGPQFDATTYEVGNWTGNNFRDIRGVQIKQAELAGKQLNPGELKSLRGLNSRFKRTPGQLDLLARNADKMENYIAKTPKWAGSPTDPRMGQKFYDKQPDGTIWRGMAVGDKKIVESIVQGFERGSPVTTMESWTTNPNTAIGFAKGATERGNHQIVLRHVNKYGAPIEKLNGMGESEVIQPRGVRYKLLSKDTTTWLEGDHPKMTKRERAQLEEFSITEIVLQAI